MVTQIFEYTSYDRLLEHMYDKSCLYAILDDAFHRHTKRHLPIDIKDIIWSHIDFSFSTIDDRMLCHIEDAYYDTIEKGARKYKKKKKSVYRLKKLYRYHVDVF